MAKIITMVIISRILIKSSFHLNSGCLSRSKADKALIGLHNRIDPSKKTPTVL